MLTHFSTRETAIMGGKPKWAIYEIRSEGHVGQGKKKMKKNLSRREGETLSVGTTTSYPK